MKKEYTIQIGEIFTEQRAQELKEYLELQGEDLQQSRIKAFEEVLDFMDKKGWVYRSDFIDKFLTP